MLALLIIFASLPVPLGYIRSLITDKRGQFQEEGGTEHHRKRYSKCSTTEPELNSNHTPQDEDTIQPRASFLSAPADHYRLLSQQEDGEGEEEEDDTEL